MKAFERNIKKAGKDSIVTLEEFKDLKYFVSDNADQVKEFQTIQKQDSLLVKKIREVLKDNKIVIEWQEKTLPDGNIHFYIETSGSMGGYLNNATELQDISGEIAGKLANDYHTIRFQPNIIVKDIKTYNDPKEYIDDLTNSRFKIGGHSPLHEIFKLILSKSAPEDVNIFITDGIISGSDKQISNNHSFNLQNRTLLKTYISSVFDSVVTVFKTLNVEYELSVYAFKSHFYADPSKGYFYYTYQNDHINKNFTSRPFYLFAFGNKKFLNEIERVLTQSSFFRPVKELHFTGGCETNNICQAIPVKSYLSVEIQRHSRITPLGEIKCENDPSDQAPVKFAVAMNLSKIPSYAQELAYLDTNLLVEHSNNFLLGKPQIMKITEQMKNNFKGKELDQIQQKGCTHIVEIEIQRFYQTRDTLTIRIRKTDDTWFEQWSVDDDKNISSNHALQDKSFNFKYLIFGLRDGIASGGDQTYFIYKTIVIK
jgi:hypothetical protein